jgi:hypothetical protein
MRCDQVICELAVPTEDRDSTALAEHLARCPACAAWAKRAAVLDRVWEATRPPEPTDQAWDALWGRVTSALEVPVAQGVESSVPFAPSQNGSPAKFPMQSAGPRQPGSQIRPRNWALIGLIGLAQAAAIVLAVGLAWHGFSPSHSPQFTQTVAPPSSSSVSGPDQRGGLVSLPTVEVEECSLIVIVIPATGEKPTVVDRTPEWMFFGVDDWLLVYNAAEALPNSVVAMKE